MSFVFADAGYWVALRDRLDVHHARSLEISKRLIGERCRIVTTAFVFAEVYAIFSRRRNARSQIMRDFWENPIVEVEQASFEDQRNALVLLKQHDDKAFSFSDALSFVIMTRRQLAQAISFDDHFRQYGRFQIIGTV